MIIKEMLSHFKNQLRPYYKQGLSPHENETLVYKDLCFPNRLFLYFIFYCIVFSSWQWTLSTHIELSGRRNFRLRCKIRRLSMKILK